LTASLSILTLTSIEHITRSLEDFYFRSIGPKAPFLDINTNTRINKIDTAKLAKYKRASATYKLKLKKALDDINREFI
jgi:hypothetical protein